MKGRVVSNPPVSPVTIHIQVTPKKSIVEAYILGLALGWLGAHHFYLRRTWFGIAYFFTFGLFGVGYVVDLFRMPWLVKETNKKLANPDLERERNLIDAYVLWFPLGLFGFHLFYLRKPGQGVLYFFTFGLLGIGFLVDLFRIPSLVRSANQDPPEPEPNKSTCVAYILGASPLGILGLHHYYLNRPLWGLLYTFTLGLCAVGWVYDWFRIPFLVKRANAIQSKEEDAGKKHLDDIYILWFPWGWLGLHHFYLNRPGWGCLYLFTIGLFGIGWLVDFCRLPCLVEEYNKTYLDRQLIACKARQMTGGQILVSPGGATVVTVTNLPPGSIMTPPPGGATAPANGALPPPYAYQSMTSYPPQAYMGAPMGYQPAPYYQNQGYNPDMPGANGMVPAAVPMPPTYEESLEPPSKSGPPPDFQHNTPKGNP